MSSMVCNTPKCFSHHPGPNARNPNPLPSLLRGRADLFLHNLPRQRGETQGPGSCCQLPEMLYPHTLAQSQKSSDSSGHQDPITFPIRDFEVCKNGTLHLSRAVPAVQFGKDFCSICRVSLGFEPSLSPKHGTPKNLHLPHPQTACKKATPKAVGCTTWGATIL